MPDIPQTTPVGTPSATSVQPSEGKQNSSIFDSCGLPRPLRRHERTYRRITRTMLNSPAEEHHRRGQRLAHCCRNPIVGVDGDGVVALSMSRCRDRLCPLCSKHRARDVAERLTAQIKRMDAPRFITLTRSSSADHLGLQVSVLLAQFRVLRHTQEWKEHVRGGVATIELTYNDTAGRWHPHLHVIVDGVYWDQASLSKVWHRVTGDSFIVDIRKVHSAEQAARYLAAYIAKGGEVGDLPPTRITEYADALHRRHLILAFGACHGVKGSDSDAGDRPRGWAFRGAVFVIAAYARAGYSDAITVMRHAHTLGGNWRAMMPLPPKDSDYGDPPPPEVLLPLVGHVAACASSWDITGRRPPPPPPPLRVPPDPAFGFVSDPNLGVD